MSGFRPTEHGRAVWKLLGFKWDATQRGIARAFEGWPAERLAGTLGVSADALRAIIEPDAAPQAIPHTEPDARILPAVGSLWRPRMLYTLHPLPDGGWTMHAQECPEELFWDRGACLARTHACRVLSTGSRYTIFLADEPGNHRRRVYRVRTEKLDAFMLPLEA